MRSSSRVTVSLVIGRADGDRRRRVARRGDAAQSQICRSSSTPWLPADATTMMPALRRLLDRLHQRVGRGRLEDRVAERQVDDVDAERALVGDRELDRANHVAGLPPPFSSSTFRPTNCTLGATPWYSTFGNALQCRRSGRRRACRDRSRRSGALGDRRAAR